ncbi:MAG: selenocysteine-specific translation elongation factor [Akkermansiaceae bacterium]|jgi:selenocysteine-specific elongation factor|nr:selenocysteine-specific translation elongation factor [Akkermansiaceae bacterium]
MSTPSNYIVATAGHIDHGKSTLIEALSGTNPDRLPEEQSRGMTIDLGFAHLLLNDSKDPEKKYSLGLIDVPGHADFVKNMVAGAGSVDVAMFVVAADDGWMPQSEEHLHVLTYLNVRNAVVALTKSDSVDDIEFSSEMVSESLKGSAFENAPIIPVCALIGDGIEELQEALIQEIKKVPPPPDIQKPRLSVDRVFSPKGVGTVITGTMTGGKFTKGQKAIIQPHSSEATIRAIQNHQHEVSEAFPGMRTALNIPDVEIRKGKSRSGVKRGDTVTIEGIGSPSRRIHALIERTKRESKAGPINHAQRIRFHHCSSNISGKLLFFDNIELEPGQQALAEIRLDKPAYTHAGDRFVLRDWSKRFTIAGGTILDPTPPRRSYRSQGQKEFLKTRSSSTDCAKSFLQSLIIRDRYLPSSEILTQSCFSSAHINQALEQIDAINSGHWIFDKKWWLDLVGVASKRIDTIHNKHPELPGIDINMLRSFMKKHLPDPKLFEILVETLETGEYIRSGTIIRRKNHSPRLPDKLQLAGKRIRDALNSSPLEPPNPKELVKSDDDLSALQFLLETGEAIQLDDKAILLSSHFEDSVEKVKRFITSNGPSTAANIRKILGTTRRIVIPFLERLDKEGITKREGDLRSLN